MDRAKSDREKSRTMYPNMLQNAQASSSSTFLCRRSFVSNPSCEGRMARFRSRITSIATKLAASAIIPVMRRAQLMLKRWMMASVPHAKTAPPTPDPAALIPLAMLRRLANHWDRTGRLGMYRKPMPQPISTPCEMYNCHTRVAKDAAMKPAHSKIRPAAMTLCMPKCRVRTVTKGATTMAIAKLKPPMKAKSHGVASGKMLSAR